MSATFSGDRKYRWILERPTYYGEFALKREPVVFCLLNPSTADENTDDATIRRCRRFAYLLGSNGIIVINLYAYRATSPKEMMRQPDPVGPDNDYWLGFMARHHKTIICAWGNNAKKERAEKAVGIFRENGAKLLVFGFTKQGQPKHPLYLRTDTKLQEWSR